MIPMSLDFSHLFSVPRTISPLQISPLHLFALTLSLQEKTGDKEITLSLSGTLQNISLAWQFSLQQAPALSNIINVLIVQFFNHIYTHKNRCTLQLCCSCNPNKNGCILSINQHIEKITAVQILSNFVKFHLKPKDILDWQSGTELYYIQGKIAKPLFIF